MRNLISRDEGGNGGAVALKISAFARKYDLCEVTVRRLIHKGQLRVVKLGNITRVLDDVTLDGASAAAAGDGDQSSAT
jgi:hypothetical protein